MINILIADNNIYYGKTLMNAINQSNDSVRICNICTDGEETLQALNSNNNIDCILLDIFMPKYSGLEVLEMLSEDKKKKYKQSVIIISGDMPSIDLFKCNPMVHSYIYKSTPLEEIINRINRFADYKNNYNHKRNIKNKIIEELQYLEYDLSYKGTQYLIETIYYMIEHNYIEIDNLSKEIYPILAKKYNTSVHNIKCNINTATTCMYYECNVNKLKDYFKFCYETKPKTKTVVYTILNKIS